MKFLPGLFLPIALLAASCLPDLGSSLSGSQQESQGITVEGDGRVPVKADRAEVRFSLYVRGSTSEEAERGLSHARDNMLGILAKLGIDSRKVESVEQSVVWEDAGYRSGPVPTATPSPNRRVSQRVSAIVDLAPNGRDLAPELASAGAIRLSLPIYREDTVEVSFDLEGYGNNSAGAQEMVSHRFEVVKNTLAARGFRGLDLKVNGTDSYLVSSEPGVTDVARPFYSARQVMKLSTERLEVLPQVAALVTSVEAHVQSITFGISNPEAVERAAREAALADARKKAEQIASGISATLGQVVAVAELSSRQATGISAPLSGPLLSAPPGRPQESRLLDAPSDTMLIRLRVTFSIK